MGNYSWKAGLFLISLIRSTERLGVGGVTTLRSHKLTPQVGEDGPTRGWGSVASHLGEQEE